MKKKLLSVLCALSLLLTGCNNSLVESADESSSQTDTENSTTSETTDNGSADPKPMGTPFSVSPYGETEKFDLPLSPGRISNVNNGRMLVIDNDTGMKAALLDLDSLTYSVTEIKLSQGYNEGYTVTPVFISGYPAVIDMLNGETQLLDDELNVLDTINLNIEEAFLMNGWDEDIVCLSTYGSNEYCVVSAENGKLSYTKRQFTPEVEHMQSAIFISESESIVLSYDFENYQSDYFLQNSETGERTVLNISENEFASYSDGKIYLMDYTKNEVSFFDAEKPAIKSTFSLPKQAWQIGSIQNGTMMYGTEDSEKVTLSRVTIEKGVADATLEICKDGDYAPMIWDAIEYDSTIYILGRFANENSILRWKPASSTAEIPWQALVKPDYSRLSSDIASEILSQYGISVLYGKKAVRYFNDYAVVSETDERKIYDALAALKTVLGKFPEGFLQELISYKQIEILLTGDILSSGQRNSITTADAFTTSLDDSEVVVVDIGIYSLQETIAHEFSHVIEDIMYLIVQNNPYNDYEVFWSWNLLNKPGFEYAFIYTHEDGTTIDDYSPDYGTYYFEGCGVDVNDIYFVDGYSTTFPSEDRARLFQKMLILSDAMPEYFKGENINNKAAYLCLCLRNCFRSLDNCEDIVWERGITIEHDLEWYRKQYSWEDHAVG